MCVDNRLTFADRLLIVNNFLSDKKSYTAEQLIWWLDKNDLLNKKSIKAYLNYYRKGVQND